MEPEDSGDAWGSVIEEKERDDVLNALGPQFGQGAYSVIYALDSLPGEALKEIHTDTLPSHILESMEAALCTLSRLRHPNLFEYKRTFRVSGYLYLQVARYHGSLESFIRLCRRRRQLVPRKLILEMIGQVASALAYLHDPDKVDSAGASLPVLVHRGIKPANILVDRTETQFVLADACISTEALRRHSSGYSPPEVLLGGEPVPASALWSLGVVLYELSTGSKPAPPDGKWLDELPEKRWTPDLSGVRDVVIRGILENLLVLDPGERISARELADIVGMDARELALASLLEIRSLKKEVRVLQEQFAVIRHSAASNPTSRLAIAGLPGITGLMQASANGDTDSVRALVDAGLDLRAKELSGMTVPLADIGFTLADCYCFLLKTSTQTRTPTRVPTVTTPATAIPAMA
ncbi:Kinase, NEK [Giardia lamblia P15]|uniref:non-specific serine/threonine protein kinase n=1 Tax=Giardia intestinalis (strain P15) TaxID=658858 RepID=E1EYU2_GIAIA|nr:Kinase, NEK [Giardia lamblia P15]